MTGLTLKNGACFGKDFINRSGYKLGGRDGNSHWTRINPKRTKTTKARRKIGGAPATKWIQHNIPWLRSLQDAEWKIKRKHREVGANGV